MLSAAARTEADDGAPRCGRGVDPDEEGDASGRAREYASRPEGDGLAVSAAPGGLAARAGNEGDDAMRVAQVHHTLRKRTVRETGTLAGMHREFDSDAMAGLDEKRELVAADRRDKRSGAVAAADKNQWTDDKVSRTCESAREIC